MMKRILFLCIFFSTCLSSISAQEKEEADSLVRLLSASSARQTEIRGRAYRIIEGPARFLHNDTYLICDTARWNVDDEYIDAIGNVQIIQENTILTGDRIHYIINENLAQFRGSLVELKDMDDNILRTKHMDYNTKDSIAFFFNGGSMKNKDGNIIESKSGKFESKINKFTFRNNVEMYSDSLYVISDTMTYFSDRDIAYFYTNTKAWKDENYLSANGGWYNREEEKLYFEGDVYIQTEDQEVWCERLHYDRETNNSTLHEKIQIFDSENKTFLLGGKLEYIDSPKFVEVTLSPIFAAEQEGENNVADTIFVAGDTLKYYSMRMCDIDSAVVAAAKERRELSRFDPLVAAKSNMTNSSQGQPPATGGKTTKRGEQGNKNEGGNRGVEGLPPVRGSSTSSTGKSGLRTNVPFVNSFDYVGSSDISGVSDISGSFGFIDYPDYSDFVSETYFDFQQDTIPKATEIPEQGEMFSGDTIPPPTIVDTVVVVPPDTSDVAFVEIFHNVKIYRNDMQVLCDSLSYTGIDSIARLYKSPVLWNEIKNQLTADSMQVVIENKKMTKGNLLSNAFVISMEDSLHYNQIKSPEMIGYFDNNELYRFDALGGLSALLFLTNPENIITTLNKKEAKLLSARFKDGAVQRVIYLENLKQDIFPLYEVAKEELKLRDFKWRGDERPQTRFALTNEIFRPSRRDEPLMAAFPKFKQTSIFFPEEFINLQKNFKIDNK